MVTDKAFFEFLKANGIADEYSGYDAHAKLGWRQLFHQQQAQPGDYCVVFYKIDIISLNFVISKFK